MKGIEATGTPNFWVIRVPNDNDSSWLARLRHVVQAEVLDCDPRNNESHWIWIRGGGLIEDPVLYSLPNAEYFHLLPNEQLVPIHRRVPTAQLPNGRWIPLDDFVEVVAPLAGWRGVWQSTPVQLVRSDQSTSVNMLQCSMAAWKYFVLQSSILRLRSLEFACAASASSEGQVICKGSPLPNVPGRFWHAEAGVAIPAGYTWRPAVDRSTLFESLSSGLSVQSGGIDSNTRGPLFLIFPDGKVQRIAGDDWCAATYAAVRATEASPS